MDKSKTVLATLGFATAAAFAGSALAQSQTQETGFYAGLGIGQSEAKDVDCSSGFSCDKKDTAWKIFGGYQFMRYVAAEVAYTDLGKLQANVSLPGVSASAESKSHAFELVAVGSYPIGTSGFAPYVKAGLYYAETKNDLNLTVGGTSGSNNVKKNNTDWTAGIGIRYDIMRNFAVRAEWQRYNDVGADDQTVTVGGTSVVSGGKSSIDVISIGAIYKF